MEKLKQKVKPLFETKFFKIEVGISQPQVKSTDPQPLPVYLVINKHTNVVEFDNSSFYFARDWALQFDKALTEQDKVIEEYFNPTQVVVEAPKGSVN